ncbi:diacylglycerol kinase family protein [Pedobacter boryungensis]|uniref:Diacylglycerol kinase family protein n=1 Tax=Pedobacter boryungensis TaxID=869962 RepID=A0ABX2DDJ4_9SPHI|nr:diacylglycerol kinase family protein [Pedobacter boryungensis]NQX32025.1 diacylglycerol kinase family protein [Pedobacter boryungensis]
MERFLKSFFYAFKGLAYAFKTQLNFKMHCFSGALIIALGLYLKLSIIEWLWISLAIALVFIVELINTAMEVLVDLVSPQQHPKAGTIKDIAAAAVLVTALLALSIGLLIFVPKLI